MVPLPRGHAMNKDLDLYPLEYDQEPEPVNTGRQGQVFVSRHRASGLRCAAKVVSLSRQNVAALHNEVRIMRRLRHPSIVSLWCVFAGPERCIMVQELCTGGDLLTHLAGARRYSEGEARGVVRAVVDALSYCHHRGVAHLDVKPENLLLASSASGARLKLADWGVAQLVPRGRRLRSPVGTAGYTAPEVLAVPRLNPRGYNQAADIWSLGAVAHLLLCGALPYHVPAGSSFAQELVIVRRRRPVVSSRREWEGVSRQARDFVERALEVDPDKRWSAPDLARHPWFSVDALAPGHGPDLLEAQACARKAKAPRKPRPPVNVSLSTHHRSMSNKLHVHLPSIASTWCAFSLLSCVPVLMTFGATVICTAGSCAKRACGSEAPYAQESPSVASRDPAASSKAFKLRARGTAQGQAAIRASWHHPGWTQRRLPLMMLDGVSSQLYAPIMLHNLQVDLRAIS